MKAALFVLLFLSISLHGQKLQLGTASTEALEISFLQLIVTPEKYHKKTVRTRAYVLGSEEDVRLWLGFPGMFNDVNSVWLFTSREDSAKIAEFSGFVCEVVGRFEYIENIKGQALQKSIKLVFIEAKYKFPSEFERCHREPTGHRVDEAETDGT